jgi:hypothetical protein
MPAIRDLTVNYTATATDTGVICAAPATATNDLLLAMVSADTGTQVWSGGDAPGKVFSAYTAGTTFTDLTAAATDDTAGDVLPLNTAPVLNDACYFAATSGVAFKGISVLISTAGVNTLTIVWEYWNGAAWTAITPVINTISNYTGTTGYPPTGQLLRLTRYPHCGCAAVFPRLRQPRRAR